MSLQNPISGIKTLGAEAEKLMSKQQKLTNKTMKNTLLVLFITIFCTKLSIAQNISNPKNPYDMIGMGHNDALNFVKAKSNFKDPSGFVKTISEFLLTKFPKNEVEKYISSSKTNNAKKLSAFENKTMAKVYEIIENGGSIETVTKKIIDLESMILVNKPQMPNGSFKTLLAATSVARFSNYYWQNNNDVKLMAKPKWLKIIFADIKGAINSEGGSTCETIGDAAEASCNAASKTK